MATEEVIEKFRTLSQEIDGLFSTGNYKAGAVLLEQARNEAEASDPAYAFFFQGEQAGYLRMDHAQQEEFFRKALELGPGDFFLLRNLGVSLSQQDKMSEALVNYERALELNPNDYQSWSNKGATLSTQGKMDEALACIEHALKLNPKDYTSWLNKGIFLSNQGKEEEALACYERALELNPKGFHTWRQKGVSLSKQGKEDEALASIERALELNPKDYHTWRSKGVSLSKQGKMDEAIVCFDRALKLYPKDYDTWRSKGVSLSKQGKMDEAIVCFDRALELNPKDYASWRQKGASLSEQGKEDEALACYERALELNPKNYESLRNKGVSLSKQGKEDEALACYEKALDLNPSDSGSWRQKGVTLSKQGRHQQALDVTEIALGLNAEDLDSQVNKAYILNALERRQDALTLIDEVVRKHPQHEYARKIQKHLHFQAGKGEVPPASGGNTGLELLTLQKVVGIIRQDFKKDAKDIKAKIKKAEQEINIFLEQESKLRQDAALFLILRKWNSYTPSIPRDDERSIGGGYYFLVNGQGTVVDPGFNFLENFHRIGGRIVDIHNIVITHAHNDHTADLESILALVHKYNVDKKLRSPQDKGFKTLRLFMNVGSDRKFSGFIDLRGAEHIETVTVLTPGHEYEFGQNLVMRVLPAYHDEVIGKKYAVGLQFELRGANQGPTRVVITSDTGLFPQKDRMADTTAKEVWELYKLEGQPIHLLIPHLGSVKESEFDADMGTEEHKVYYPNHLGLIGTIRVITALKPELAVVSEFGEELRKFQERLVEMIGACVHKFPYEGKRIEVLPGDITFMYDLRQRGVHCINCGNIVPPSPNLIAHKDGDCFYYLDRTKGTTDLDVPVKRFKDKLKQRRLRCLHAIKEVKKTK